MSIKPIRLEVIKPTEPIVKNKSGMVDLVKLVKDNYFTEKMGSLVQVRKERPSFSEESYRAVLREEGLV